MPLGMEASTQTTLCWMGTQHPQKKVTAPTYPIFGPCPLWPNGWMDEDATWYGSIDLGPDHIVLDVDPAPPTERGTVRLRGFGHISISGLGVVA